MTDTPANTEHVWSACTKNDSNDTFPVALSAFGICASFWEANEQFDLGEKCWPTKANGFVLECTTAGRTGAREPRYGTNAGDFAVSGSAIFTLRVPSISDAVQPIDSVIAYPDDGLAVQGVIVNENTKIFAEYVGGTADTDYVVRFEFMVGGRKRVGRQTVHVQAR